MAALSGEDGGLSLHVNSYGPYEHFRPHAHDTANVTMVLSGELEERADGAVARAGVLSVVVKPRNRIHEDRFGPSGARMFQLRLTPELARIHAGDLPYQWVSGGEVARAMTSLLAEPSPDSQRIWGGFLDILAALSISAHGAWGRSIQGHIRELAARIDEDPASGISVRELAEEHGLHPVSLARAFRRAYGCSIMDYLRRARILRACRIMDEGAVSLSLVAAETGFADQAHFTRAFRLETGLPPGAFRKMSQSAIRR